MWPKLEFDLPWPSNVTEEVLSREYCSLVVWFIRSSISVDSIAPVPLEGRIHLDMNFHAPGKAKFNMIKRAQLILDAMRTTDLWKNDAQVTAVVLTKGVMDKENPRVHIAIHKYGD